jgi:serine protease
METWHRSGCTRMLRKTLLIAIAAVGMLAAGVSSAHAEAWWPNDPGVARGWQALQWNLAGSSGIRMPAAWERLRRLGVGGARGVTVAVLDTGVAYANHPGFRRAPDFRAHQFVAGHDFVGHDRYADDPNGHGTAVASVIAEATNNGIGFAGIAYQATIMPVRVLDARGEGDPATVAQGITWAARHGADVINVSLELPALARSERRQIEHALDVANAHDALVVASVGNGGHGGVTLPATDPRVLGVGASTEGGCPASYSNWGQGLDLIAPGGGSPTPTWAAWCDSSSPTRQIFTQVFEGSPRRFAAASAGVGTSWAAAHASGTAALVIAVSRGEGQHLSPARIRRLLCSTARDVGPTGFDDRSGAGLLDADAATRAAAALTR